MCCSHREYQAFYMTKSFGPRHSWLRIIFLYVMCTLFRSATNCTNQPVPFPPENTGTCWTV